ncbi:MAG: 3-hydroxyacyl-ACP dehydratase FabZ family protein [Planctomycetota bacterium]|jgi:3-hydroxyacyl-[acyl-carrier-protein] dehydratase
MRWIWIDTFTEFVSGKTATAVKNLTLAEEYLHDHFPGYPIMPPSLMIEGMAQTAGILVGEARNFEEKVILAKIRRARFDDYPRVPDRISYRATLESIDDAGATTSGVVFRNDKQIGCVDLMFSHVDRSTSDLDLPEHNFVFTEQFMSLLQAYRITGSSR